MHVSPRARLLAGASRGLMYVRADAGAPSGAEIKALIEGINAAFAAFKAEHTAQLAEVKRGLSDVVTAEKVDRINAAVGEQQKALDDAMRRLAALQIGGGAGGGETPEARAHREGFAAWVRKGAVQAAVTTYNDPNGGFLAPPTLDTAVSRVLSAVIALRRLAQVLPISTSSYIKFKSLGGATSGWVSQTQTGATGRPETSTPQLARMEFTPGEVYAEPYTTQTALDDMVIDVEDWLASEVNIEFAEKEGAAFVSGTGIEQPRGFLSYPIVANSSYAWGKVGYVASGAASDFATANPADALIDTIHALKPGYRQAAAWLLNDLTAAKVRKFKDGEGNYLWQPALQAGQAAQLLGYRVESDDNMPDVGANKYPIAFGAWSQAYLIVDRTGVRVQRNPFKSNGHVTFYTTKRVGGGIQDFAALKLLKIATS